QRTLAWERLVTDEDIRLRAPKHSAFEFAFGMEPIVHITAWLFAAFQIDFVGATSDLLITRRALYRSLSRLRPGGGSLRHCTSCFFLVSMTYAFPSSLSLVVVELRAWGDCLLATFDLTES